MHTLSPNNIDVLIVGAGPVGLFCANELLRHGLTCRIIDKKSHLSEQSKALGLHIRTLDVLEDCGLLDKIKQQGQKVDGALIKSNDKILVDANFSSLTCTDRHYLIDLPQNQTEEILYQSLLEKGGTVDWETELTHISQAPEEITATLKTGNFIQLYNANWLIACDGAHSTVRHLLNMEFKGAPYKQMWWLADVHIDWQVNEHRFAAYIDKNGPLACFPMGGKRWRIVMTATNESLEAPTLNDIAQVFKQRVSDNAVLYNPIWLSAFSIHHRQIQHYREDRVFFSGDAAHIHSPMGGQGLNTGLQDVYNLVWKLAMVIKKQARPKLLDTYHEERFPIGQDVLKKTDMMTRMILLKNPLAIRLRNLFIRFMASIPFIKNQLIKDIAELSISYNKSSIVHISGHNHSLKAGSYIPNFELIDAVSQKKQNSKTLTKGTLHHLFIFAGQKANKIPYAIQLAQALTQKYAHTIKVHLVLIEKTTSIDPRISLLLDPNKEVHRQYKLKKTSLLLVRPDKYIGMVQTPINEKKFQKNFIYILRPDPNNN
jgi:2-polyprenyl-6-methoxyphenol hydroxylase-like FAD-dependent oxidoreductase